MLVREVMSKPAVTVNDGATVKAAIALLEQHEISAMPVVDSSGQLIGVVSEADVIREMVVPDQRVHEIPVRLTAAPLHVVVADIMSTHPVTVSADTDLAVATDLMTSSAIKSLPVLDDGRLVGVVSRRDVIRVLARPDVRLESEIDELFRQTGHDWLVDVTDGVAVIDGPVVASEQDLAQALANTVPGIVGIRFRSTRSTKGRR
jgi:CBS domain-containing protein